MSVDRLCDDCGYSLARYDHTDCLGERDETEREGTDCFERALWNATRKVEPDAYITMVGR